MINFFERKLKMITQKDLFFVGYIIYISCLLIELSMFTDYAIINPLLTLFRYISYALFLIKILLDIKENRILKIRKESFFSLQNLLKIFMLFSILAYTVKTRDKTLVFFSLVILSSYGINFKEINKTCLYVNIVLFLVIISTCLLKVIPNLTFYRETGGLPRYSLGYTYPLDVATLMFFSLLMFIYQKNGIFKSIEIVCIEIVNVMIYYLTDARTAFYLITLICIFLFFYKYINKLKWFVKFTKLIQIFSIPLITLFCVFSSYFFSFDNKVLNFINSILSNRLFFAQNGIKFFGITLFGQPIHWIGYGGHVNVDDVIGKYNFVDCSYVQTLLQYGVFVLITIVLMYCWIMWRERKNRIIIFIIFFIGIYCITEPRLLDLRFNPFILLGIYAFLPMHSNYKEFNIYNYFKKIKRNIKKEG